MYQREASTDHLITLEIKFLSFGSLKCTSEQQLLLKMRILYLKGLEQELGKQLEECQRQLERIDSEDVCAEIEIDDDNQHDDMVSEMHGFLWFDNSLLSSFIGFTSTKQVSRV